MGIILFFGSMLVAWVVGFVLVFLPERSAAKEKEEDVRVGELEEKLQAQDTITASLQDKEAEIHSLRDELQKARADYVVIESELKEVKEKPVLDQELTKQKELYDASLIETNRLQKENDEFKNKLAEKEKTFQDKLSQSAAAQTAFADKDATIESLKAQNKEIADKVQSVQFRIQELEEQLKNAPADGASSSQEELEKLKYDYANLQTQLQEFKTKPDLSNELTKQKELYDVRKVDLELLQKQNEELKNKLTEKEKTFQDKLSQSAAVDAAFKEKDDKLKALEEEKRDALDKFKAHDVQLIEVDQLKQQNKEMIDKLKSAQLQIKGLEEAKAQDEIAIGSTAAAERAIKQKNEIIENLEKENKEMVDKISITTSRLKKIEEQLKKVPPEGVKESVQAPKVLEGQLLKAKKEDKKGISKARKRLETAAQQKKERIGEILLKNKFITQDILDKALEHYEKFGVGVTQYLLAYGYIDQEQLTQCLCTQFGFPFLPLKSYNIPDEIIDLVPVDIVEKYWLIPVDKRENMLTIVMADPLNDEAIKEVEEVTSCKVLPFVGFFSDIIDALESYYKVIIEDKASGDKKTTAFFIDTEAYRGIERRKARRFSVDLDVHFPIEGEYRKAKIRDVSRSGFLIESKSPLPIGSVFTIQIDLPKELASLPMGIVVKVMRVISLENNMFGIGVHMVKMSKEDINILLKYASS